MTSSDSVVQWRGPVTLTVAEQIQADVDAAVLTVPVGQRLVIDLTQVEYLDSIGLGLLIHARNRCLAEHVELVVRGMSDRSRRLLAMSGLAALFVLEDGQAIVDILPGHTPLPAEPDPMFDQIAALARRVVGVPTALVSLVDRTQQVFPGAVGLPDPWQETRCTPLSHSFCQYVVARREPLIVTDATVDPVLADNLAIADLGVVAYAGMPLTDLDGNVVGSLCAIDSTARQWTELELANLADLAAACSAELHKRAATRRAAVAVDRERIARDLHRYVIGQLFSATFALGNARAMLSGVPDDLVAGAVDTIDDAIATIRDTVFSSDLDTETTPA